MWLLLTVVAFSSGAAHGSDTSLQGYAYVVNLASAVKPIKKYKPLDAALSARYRIYAVRIQTKGSYGYRLRLGFFRNITAARVAQHQVARTYPGAWVDKVYPGEMGQLKEWLSSHRDQASSVPARPTLSEETSTRLMEQARLAMIGKQYKKAIMLYTKVAESGAGKYAEEAQEYLGLARERNGQLAHAQAEYRTFLKKYPKSQYYARVKQRLAGLVTAYDEPQKLDMQKQKNPVKKQPTWDFFGILLQYYDRDVIDTQDFGKIIANSSLSTILNYSGRLYNSDYKVRTNLSAVHIYDVEHSTTDDERLTTLYADVITPSRNTEARLGRQKGRSLGVIGRFDGFDVGQRISPRYKLKLIAGYPVELSKTVENRTDKYFYSVGLEMGPLYKHWDASIFSLEQKADGLVDRQEVGGELRYRTENESLFTLFDYSLAFNTTNYITAVYNRRFEDKSTLDVIADYRKSPFLTTTNALQGQVGLSTLADLLDTMNESQIEQLSQDRTSLYKSVTVLHTRPWNDRIELNADFSISNLSGTAASGGVEATQGTGNEYSLSGGMIGNNLFTDNDVNIANLRLSKLYNSDVMVLYMTSRIRFSGQWRVGPRLRYEDRSYDDGRQVNKIKPSVRVDYRRNRDWQFEMEVGQENKETHIAGNGTEKESTFSLHLGYTYAF